MGDSDSCRGIPPYPYLRTSRYERSVASAPAPQRRFLPPFALRFMELKRIRVKRDVPFLEHRHKFFEFFIAEKGLYECAVNGFCYKAEPGELVFIQPGDTHSDHYIQGARFLIVQYEALDIEGHCIEEGVFDKNAPPEARKFAIAPKSRLALLLAALGRPGDPKQEHLRTLEPLCQAFFWELIATIPEGFLSSKFSSRKTGESFRFKALEAFANTSVRDFDVASLALALGMSRRTMETKFKGSFGSSPAHAFMAFKAAEAVKLLAAGLGVKETSESLGFANQFHFSRVCRRYAGSPPSALRQNGK